MRVVPVSALVDAMLELHGDRYLRGWVATEPEWPSDLLVQPTRRWMAELDELIRGPMIFGRIAILGWCLLDDRVAAEAEACGLLAGIAHGISPSVPEHLTPAGLQLLRRRAPLAALTIDELSPTVELRTSEPPSGSAVARHPAGSAAQVGRWALASRETLYVGTGSSSTWILGSEATTVPVLHHDEGEKAPAVEVDAPGTEAVQVRGAPPVAMGWSARGELDVFSEGQAGLLRYDARRDLLWLDARWPRVESAAIGERDVAAVPSPGGQPVMWGVIGGGPVPLGAGGPGSVDRLAVSRDRVAVVGAGQLWLGGPDQQWSEPVDVGAALALAATGRHVIAATQKGEVRVVAWDRAVADISFAPLPGQEIRHACGSDEIAVVASDYEVAILRGAAVIGRWRAADGEQICTVAVGPEGRTLLVGVADRVRLWRIDREPQVRLTNYTADSPEGADLLGVRPTVEAIAALVVARAVQPPLSIGLFGAWGSGKTFFMRQLEQRIFELTTESRRSNRAQSALWAWRNVRQVRFNAWQYAAADVWAGMLEQLVAVLARPTKGSRLLDELPEELALLERRRIERLAGVVAEASTAESGLEAAQDKLSAAQQQAREKVEALEGERAEARKLIARAPAEVLIPAARKELRLALDRAGLPDTAGSLDRTLLDIEQARRSVWTTAGLARGPGRGGVAAALAVIVVAGIAVTVFLQGRGADLAGAFGLLTSVVTAIGVGARWISGAVQRVNQRLTSLDALEAKARTAMADAATRLAEAQAKVVDAECELAAAIRARDDAERAVGDARRHLEDATPGGLLAEYLRGRHTEGDYRAMLGLIGTVHRDLEVISAAVVKNNDALLSNSGRAADDAVNRVVLYIDDLDRCPPTVVVRVLEAVAMMLTFPLFVVVVAVDAHWISKSLAAVYPSLLTGGDVTPDNYLEKIFQMPVWLERPSDEAAAAMVRALLGEDRPVLSAAGNGMEAQPPDQPSPHPAEKQAAAALAGGAVRPANVSLATTPPTAVALDRSEVTDIEGLAPLLARSPRALKRYLNTYRVLKALVDAEHLDSVRLLLAVATGRPDVGERMLAEVATAEEHQTLGTLIAEWPAPDRQWLEANIPNGRRGWKELDCTELQSVAAAVRRFVFHAGHPSTTPEADTPEASARPRRSHPTQQATRSDPQPPRVVAPQ